MEYFLLYESMLDTVLYARDKWLADDNLLFPNRAIIWLAPIEDEDYDESRKIGFWDDAYGVNMNSIQKRTLYEPFVDVVTSQTRQFILYKSS